MANFLEAISAINTLPNRQPWTADAVDGINRDATLIQKLHGTTIQSNTFSSIEDNETAVKYLDIAENAAKITAGSLNARTTKNRAFAQGGQAYFWLYMVGYANIKNTNDREKMIREHLSTESRNRLPMIRKFKTAYLLYLLLSETAFSLKIPWRIISASEKNANEYIGFLKYVLKTGSFEDNSDDDRHNTLQEEATETSENDVTVNLQGDDETIEPHEVNVTIPNPRKKRKEDTEQIKHEVAAIKIEEGEVEIKNETQ